MAEVSIRVIGRFRPINSREKEEQKKEGWDDDDVVPFEIKEERAVEILPAPSEGRRDPLVFTIDNVLWNCSQIKAFETIALPTVKDTMRGYNGTIFAYGQTGSGKTFSMFGPELPPEAAMSEDAIEHMGLIPRSCFWLFGQLESHPSITTFEVKVSALEIYVGNQLRDLLHPRTKGMKIRDGVKGVFVQGLQFEPVSSVIDVLQYIELANSHRTVSATKMNATSSRSHSVFTFLVQFNLKEGGKKISKLNFADLAGSEKVGKTGATGVKLQEGAAINKSLTVLGRVISSLAKGSNAPFREAGLTHILKDSLSGNTKTTLLVCLSPHKFNVNETINTLQFAGRAKMIKNKIKANKVLTSKDLKREIKRLNKENEDLKKKLRHKLTKATTIEAPEQGLPYLKITFTDQEEPTSDAQYIIRRKEVQKEIRNLIDNAGLNGITVETEIRRSKGDEKMPNGIPQVNRLPSIAEESKSNDEHVPLVVHVLFQPSDIFHGAALIEAKNQFLEEIQTSGTLFATGEIDEGFANPEDYGASLSVSMQRKILDELNALHIERDHLEKELSETANELDLLQERVKHFEMDQMDKRDNSMALQREIAELQDENVSLKSANLAQSMSNISLRNILEGADSPSSSEGSPRSTSHSLRKKSTKSKPPAGLPPTINEDEDYDADEDDDQYDDSMSMEELETRMSRNRNGRTPRKPRTSFITIDGSASPLFSVNTPGSPIASGFKFPERKKTDKSKLRRMLSVRDEFKEIGTDDTFNIQDQSLADLKIICKQLEQDDHPAHEKLVDIRNLMKHTVNRMRIVCDELELENQDHEEYVELMKEQLDTRHKELDAAYEDIELLRGTLEKRQMILDNAITIEVPESRHVEFVDGEEVVEAKASSPNLEVVEDPSMLPEIKSATPRMSGGRSSFLDPHMSSVVGEMSKRRSSFVDMVAVVSQKLALLRHDHAIEPVNIHHATIRGGHIGDHFRQETIAGINDWFDEEKEVIDWLVTDVISWLESIEDGALERYCDQFEQMGVNGEALLSFSHHDLLNDFNMDREHIKMFFKDLSDKSEIVKMRLKEQKIERERKRQKKRKREHTNTYFSTLIRSEAYERHIEKLWQKEFGPKRKTVNMKKVFPGDLVDVGNGRKGRVFWKGEIPEKEGQFIGVELHEGIGKNDGSFNEVRYFRTLPGCGIFTKNAYEVIKLSRANSTASIISDPKPADPTPKLQDVDVESTGSLSEVLTAPVSGSAKAHHRSNTSISESGDDSFDFSFSDSDDDDVSETVTFGHNRQFSQIPTVRVSKIDFPF